MKATFPQKAGETNLNNIFSVIKYIPSLSFQHAINIKNIELFYILFFFQPQSSKCGLYFYTNSTFQFRLATFSELNSHMWLVASQSIVETDAFSRAFPGSKGTPSGNRRSSLDTVGLTCRIMEPTIEIILYMHTATTNNNIQLNLEQCWGLGVPMLHAVKKMMSNF